MDINKMDISIYDKVQLLLENRAPGEELLLIIKPGEVTHADYFNDYYIRDTITELSEKTLVGINNDFIDLVVSDMNLILQAIS